MCSPYFKALVNRTCPNPISIYQPLANSSISDCSLSCELNEYCEGYSYGRDECFEERSQEDCGCHFCTSLNWPPTYDNTSNFYECMPCNSKIFYLFSHITHEISFFIFPLQHFKSLKSYFLLENIKGDDPHEIGRCVYS